MDVASFLYEVVRQVGIYFRIDECKLISFPSILFQSLSTIVENYRRDFFPPHPEHFAFGILSRTHRKQRNIFQTQ